MKNKCIIFAAMLAMLLSAFLIPVYAANSAQDCENTSPSTQGPACEGGVAVHTLPGVEEID